MSKQPVLDQHESVPPPRGFREPALQWMAYVLLAAAVCLHVRDAFHVLGEDLAQADPPAHFTTGVMLYDFLRHPTTAALIEKLIKGN